MSVCRYTDIKEDIAEELENLRDEGKALENVKKRIFWNSKRLIFNFQIGIAKENFNGRGKRNTFPPA